MTTPAGPTGESLGQRIGRLRTAFGWTQAELAARLAASRVAVSHFEMGLAVPSERTVVLLAGLFKVEPDELVEGTGYPAAKREKLPTIACRYTEVELQLALLRRDLEWISRLQADPCHHTLAVELHHRWSGDLRRLGACAATPEERELIRRARSLLAQGR